MVTVLAIPVLLGAIGFNRKRGLLATVVFVGLTIGAVQWMDLSSHGWFTYYLFEVASQHTSDWQNWPNFVRVTLWDPMPIGLAFALFAFGCGALKGRFVYLFYAGVLAVSWVHAFTGLLHNGGHSNALIPYCGTLAILIGISIEWICKRVPTAPVTRRLQATSIGVIFLQFFALAYDHRAALPRKRDMRAGQAMLERWRKVAEGGPVYSFGFGYYEMLAGSKSIHAHSHRC